VILSSKLRKTLCFHSLHETQSPFVYNPTSGASSLQNEVGSKLVRSKSRYSNSSYLSLLLHYHHQNLQHSATPSNNSNSSSKSDVANESPVEVDSDIQESGDNLVLLSCVRHKWKASIGQSDPAS
jgi:hypothetical protein